MIKCILFDIGGVIIDFYNNDDYYPYLSRISGVPLEKVTRIVDTNIRVGLDKGEMSQKDFDRKVAEQLGIKEKDVGWYPIYVRKARLDKGTIGIAKRLHKNYSLAYLSNTDRSRYLFTVKKLLKKYLYLFNFRFASCNIKLRKPEAGVYQHVLHRMNLKSSEVVFTDNQIENVVGARKAGIKAIWFKNSKDLERKLKKLGIGF